MRKVREELERPEGRARIQGAVEGKGAFELEAQSLEEQINSGLVAPPSPPEYTEPKPVIAAPEPIAPPPPATSSYNPQSTTSVSQYTKPLEVHYDASKTSFKCYQSADWAELCVYSNLCFDGDKSIIFDDSQPEGTAVKRHFQVGDNTVGHHTFDVYPRPPKPSEGLPLNTRAKAYYMPTSVLRGQSNIELEWTNEAMWVVDPEYRSWEVQHPFFWAHSIFAMWEARTSNATWGGVMPPIDRIQMPLVPKVEMNQWNTATLDIIRQPQTVLYTQSDTNAMGIAKDKKYICSKRAVITGHKPNIFSGIAPCHRYRSAMYEKFGFTGDDRTKKNVKPPHHLVIWSRKGRRGFINEDEIIRLVESYKIPYTLVTNHGSFENQVKLMSQAGVLLLAHGAAATNTMFQPHRSVLIEVFPYLRKRFGFGNLAQTCGNFYYPLYSWQKDPKDDRINGQLFRWKCDHRSSIDTNYEYICDQASKGGNIIVDIPMLERLLIDAFDTIGKRIYKDGKRPPRPERPEDGRVEMLDTWTDPWLDE